MKREAATGRSLTHFYHEQSQLVRVQRSVTKVITRTRDCQIAMLSHLCGEFRAICKIAPQTLNKSS